MAKGATIRLFHATAAGNLPPAGSLVEGELALDALSNPARLWTQVPTSRDPSGRIDLLAQGGVSLPVSIANGGTNAITAPLALDSLSGSSGATAGYLSRNAAGAWTVSALSVTSSEPTDGRLMFVEAGTNVLRATPSIRLFDGTQIGMHWIAANAVAANGPYLTLRHSRGTLVTPGNTVSGDQLGVINFGGAPHTAGQTASITGFATQAWTTANKGARLDFSTIPNNTNIPALAMTIEQDRSVTLAIPLAFGSGGTGTNDVGGPATSDFAAGGAWPLVVTEGTYISRTNTWTANSSGLWGDWASNVSGESNHIGITRARGTKAAPTAVANGDSLGSLLFYGWPRPTTTGVSNWQCAIVAETTQAHTVANHGSRLSLMTTANNANLLRTVLLLDQDASATFSGTVRATQRLITQNSAGNPSMSVQDTSGTALRGVFWASSALAQFCIGVCDANGSPTAQWGYWNTPGNLVMAGTITPGSDERSKTGISDYACGLAEILQLRPRQWDRGGEHQAGLVGQEVENIIPEAVAIGPINDIKDFRFIRESAVVAALINAVKELAAKVEKLDGRSN